MDSDLLRTFLSIADAGSFTKGAERINRSQSAASLQIKQLEELLGQEVFKRHRRGVTLSQVGEKLEPVARQITSILDHSLADLKADPLQGTIRIGIPDDYGPTYLARIIGDFSRHHPHVEIIVQCALSHKFPDALKNGELDIAVYECEHVASGMEMLYKDNIVWVASRHHSPHQKTPIPIATFDRQCWWRDRAIDYLEDNKIDYRIAYSSESVSGVVAAIKSGIAVGMLGERTITDDMIVLGEVDGFKTMPDSKLVLDCPHGADNPINQAMVDAIRKAFG